MSKEKYTAEELRTIVSKLTPEQLSTELANKGSEYTAKLVALKVIHTDGTPISNDEFKASAKREELTAKFNDAVATQSKIVGIPEGLPEPKNRRTYTGEELTQQFNNAIAEQSRIAGIPDGLPKQNIQELSPQERNAIYKEAVGIQSGIAGLDHKSRSNNSNDVLIAQMVANAGYGEHLKEDGKLGPKTKASAVGEYINGNEVDLKSMMAEVPADRKTSVISAISKADIPTKEKAEYLKTLSESAPSTPNQSQGIAASAIHNGPVASKTHTV